MPGTAHTSSFFLSTATVMIGAMTDLHLLNPDAHSIGLVKNFQVSSDPKLIELGQGLPNQTVASVKADDGVKCSMEVYEYTIRNIAYAAGLDGSGAGYDPITTTYPTNNTTVNAADVALTVSGNHASFFAIGNWIYIQSAGNDVVHIAKVTAVNFSSPDTTVTFTGYAIPNGVSYPIGSTVGVVKRISVGGSTSADADLCAKIVGLMPKNNAPFVILFPKIKVTKGIGVSFNIDNFGNLPFEFTPYAQLPADPFYSAYGLSPMILFPGGTT